MFQTRTKGSTGQDPCPQLQWQAGIWKFDAARPAQTQKGDGRRYAMKDGQPSGEWEIFADNIAGLGNIVSPKDARHSPAGLATGPDGALYISDSVKGKVWKIVYEG